MQKTFALFFILSFFASIGVALPVDEIKAECGGRARLVWCQDAGDGSDAGAAGNNLRLVGFDTDDGRGERRILAKISNYTKPLLTPDGNKIIFSNRLEDKIYIVGFDGSGLKTLANGLALAVWRDALTGKDWVYAGTVINQPDSVIVNVRRFRLDKLETNEPVWSKTPVNPDNFQLSADGKQASGSFPWPSCGVAVLPDRGWTKYGDGCWPSLSPDNEGLFWIFDGAHRNLTFFRTKTGERWVVNINNVPGIDAFEVYHPRWSNHPLYMVMTGPYKMGGGDNRIRAGGREIEIYLGKFSADFRKIERWIKVTHNEYADFFPDLWLANRPLVGSAGADTKPEIKAADGVWPICFEKLVFFWQNRSRANSFVDPVDGRLILCRAEARGLARYGRNFEMKLAGGAFIADGGAGELLEKCVASGQLGIEVLITPEKPVAGAGLESTPSAIAAAPSSGGDLKDKDLRSPPGRDAQSGSAEALRPIIGYAGAGGKWNFLLGQKNARLIFQLRSARGGPDYLLDLGAIALDKPGHVIVSVSSAGVGAYLNGEKVFSADSVYGGNWRSGAVVFGNDYLPDYGVQAWGTGVGWRGSIENVAIYARWIGPEEAREKYKASVAGMAGRKNPPGLSVKATLISEPGVPAPASIAPYRRALLAGHYRIDEIIEGTCAVKDILAARWAILDGKVLKSRPDTGKGAPALRLELFSDHPELESERLIMDNDRYDLPLYFDTSD